MYELKTQENTDFFGISYRKIQAICDKKKLFFNIFCGKRVKKLPNKEREKARRQKKVKKKQRLNANI